MAGLRRRSSIASPACIMSFSCFFLLLFLLLLLLLLLLLVVCRL